MRRRIAFGVVSVLVVGAAGACSGTNGSGFPTDGGGSGSGSGGSGSGSGGISSGDDGGLILTNDGGVPPTDGGIVVTTKTTIYANTDVALYQLDPSSSPPAITQIGPFAGIDASSNAVTDVAVNAAGEVYVNTEYSIYKCVLPSGGTGPVQLTNGQQIVYPAGTTTTPRMYALAFAPPGLLSPPGADGGAGTVETLVGGDGNGEVWSIDPATGNAKDLGNFGSDPTSGSTNFLGLSGDIVFYNDATGAATGLATIRSCAPPPAAHPTYAPTCSGPSDFLAGINVAELTKAYATGTPSLSLNGGMYGGSTTATGPGTGSRDLFGLGAWEGNVFAFTRAIAGKDGGAAGAPPQLLSISTASGAGAVVPETFDFTSGGWSGAGVTTKVTVTVTAPPPPPPPK